MISPLSHSLLDCQRVNRLIVSARVAFVVGRAVIYNPIL